VHLKTRVTNTKLDFDLPITAFKELNNLERHGRYNTPVQWGVDVFGELGQDYVDKYVAEEARKYQESHA
jgi:hypothetical protein